MLRRRIPTLITVALFVAVAGGSPTPANHVSVAAVLPQAPTLTKPNIVLYMTDDQTMEAVAKMPYVSSRTDWFSFDRAQVENGLCCPSRAATLTGQFDTHNRVGNNDAGHFLNEKETLPVWLQRAGYKSGLFGKYLNVYPFGRGLYTPAGWSEWQVPFSESLYKQYNWDLNNNGVKVHYGASGSAYEPDVLANKMVTFIQKQATANQPFFAMYTPSATHSPWQASPTRMGTYKYAPVTPAPNFNYVANNQPGYLKRRMPLNAALMDSNRRLEWDAAASIDDDIKRIDAALQSSNVAGNTVVIFMTDNGYSFGSHRWERKRCEFNECASIPMLVRYPGLAGGHDPTNIVTNVDLAPTITELAGATPAIAQDGISFVPLLLGTATAPWRDSILLHWPGGDMKGLSGKPDSIPQFWGVLGNSSSGLYKYVEIDTGERELYDEAADPYEMTNHAGDPAYAGVQAEFAARLNALKVKAGPTATGAPLRTDQPAAGPIGTDVD
ncbi:MAG: sulfatase-like hydrolase/transferase [Mycobacteriales bacterium]